MTEKDEVKTSVNQTATTITAFVCGTAVAITAMLCGQDGGLALAVVATLFGGEQIVNRVIAARQTKA